MTEYIPRYLGVGSPSRIQSSESILITGGSGDKSGINPRLMGTSYNTHSRLRRALSTSSNETLELGQEVARVRSART